MNLRESYMVGMHLKKNNVKVRERSFFVGLKEKKSNAIVIVHVTGR